jgi:hypothetical protein
MSRNFQCDPARSSLPESEAVPWVTDPEHQCCYNNRPMPTRQDNSMRWACKIARSFAVVIVLTVSNRPAVAYKPVTIAQLEQVLAAARGKSDKALARQLGELELTERLSTLRLEKLQASLPGKQSRQALHVLSDISAFRDLPAAEIPSLAVPDSDTQNKILSKTANYIREKLPRQIDLVVRRDTAQYDNLKIVSFTDSAVPPTARPKKTVTEALANAQVGINLSVASAVVKNQPYHLIETSSEKATYRNGAEELVGPRQNPKAPPHPPRPGLSNWGVFGPLLEVVVHDISATKTEWGHWEQGQTSTLAVFRYSIPEDQSNYDVQYCCFTSDRNSSSEFWNVYETLVAYRGEIAVDPETGAILRLTLQTDIPSDAPIYRADILVEYGPVELGGKQYLLPTKSVSIYEAPVPVRVNEANCADFHCTPANFVHPNDTVVSDTDYHSWHVFRGETRILPTDASDPPASPQSQKGTTRKQQP